MSRRAGLWCGAALGLAACTGHEPPVPAAPAAREAAVPQAVVQYALETAPSGEAVGWRAEGSAEHGTVTPMRTYRSVAGFCREYAATLHDGNGTGRAWQATACRDAAGVWRPPAVEA